MSPIPAGWITVIEAADRLGIHHGTVSAWARRGKITGGKYFSGRAHAWFVDPDSLPEPAIDISTGEWLTVEMIAAQCHVADDTVRSWIRSGMIPAERALIDGLRRWVVRASDAPTIDRDIPPGWKTAREVAADLGFHDNRIYQLINSGDLVAERLWTVGGPRWMVCPDSVTRFIESRNVVPLDIVRDEFHHFRSCGISDDDTVAHLAEVYGLSHHTIRKAAA